MRVKKENRFGELKREKGSSFLALVEEVGIVGLILFILPILFVLKYYVFLSESKNIALVINGSLLIALIIHAQFEAWMVGVSEFNLLIYLMLLFLANQLSVNNKLQITSH